MSYRYFLFSIDISFFCINRKLIQEVIFTHRKKPAFDKGKESLKDEIDELNESNSTLTDEVARR